MDSQRITRRGILSKCGSPTAPVLLLVTLLVVAALHASREGGKHDALPLRMRGSESDAPASAASVEDDWSTAGANEASAAPDLDTDADADAEAHAGEAPAAAAAVTTTASTTAELVRDANLAPRFPSVKGLTREEQAFKWYSQANQDKLAYLHFFRGKRAGVFVELGAADGVTFSNTRYFQDTMGWSGVLIEPSEDYDWLVRGVARYSSPGASRGQKLAPRCAPQAATSTTCLNLAVCASEGKVTMLRGGESKALSGNSNLFSSVVSNRTSAEINKYLLKSSPYEVRCAPFGKLLREAGVTRIDFWSLDVEGFEEVVLSTMDWSIPVHVLVVESEEGRFALDKDAPRRKHDILRRAGMRFLGRHELDEWWINPAYDDARGA